MTSVETITYQNLVVEAGAVRNKQHVLADGAKSVGDIMKKVLSAGAVTAGAGNTGNGVGGTVTVGASAKLGTYSLTCIAAGAPVAGAATGEADAANAAGTGTITAAPTVGAGAKVGVYRLTCIGVETDKGVFLFEDPDGIEIGVVNATVENTAGGLTFTIADGATDFTEGEGFTITVAAAAGNSGTFRVLDPQGNRMADLTVGAAYDNGAIAFTLADGSTDFAVGDTFTIAVTDAGTVAEADGYCNVLAGILLEDSDSTSAATYPIVMVAGGKVKQNKLNAPSGLTVAGFKEELLKQLGIEMVPATFVP